MTEIIAIPIWAMLIFLPMIFSIFVLLIKNVQSQALMKADIKNINNRLTRIEQLLDSRIISQK